MERRCDRVYRCTIAVQFRNSTVAIAKNGVEVYREKTPASDLGMQQAGLPFRIGATATNTVSKVQPRTPAPRPRFPCPP